MPILAGAGGALVATVGAEKLGMNPAIAAWGTAGIGAATALGTHGIVQQVATGVGAAGVCLGALQLFANARAESAKRAEQHKAHAKRQAEADGYVTRAELGDMLAKSADQQKQANCDFVAALRQEIKQVIAETQAEKTPVPQSSASVYPFYRGASGDEDERNAAAEDDYARSAYGEDFERNAGAAQETYERNAYGDDYERHAAIEDAERNAAVADEERNAGYDDEPNVVEEYGPN